ncbi:MAG: hypothetical protein SchgKO_23150 [Schleiferiaceae bacterium]
MDLASQLLTAIKDGKDTEPALRELQLINEARLLLTLRTEEQRLSFWINLYNAFYILEYKSGGTEKIFTKKEFALAGNPICLDDIEHTILRKRQWKYGLGYIKNPFATRVFDGFAPSQKYPKIHFALNCGAVSCPPLHIYHPENLRETLDKVTEDFLQAETEINEAKKSIKTNRILGWFIGDFGGKGGVKKMISKAVNKDLKGFSLSFKKYDWTPKVGVFE